MDQNEVLFWKDLYVVLVYNFFFVINGSKDRFFQACYLLHSSELLALYMYALWTLLWAVTPWPSFRNKWCINSREKEWFLGKTNKSFIVSCFAFMNVGPKQTRIYVTILKKEMFFSETSSRIPMKMNKFKSLFPKYMRVHFEAKWSDFKMKSFSHISLVLSSF